MLGCDCIDLSRNFAGGGACLDVSRYGNVPGSVNRVTFAARRLHGRSDRGYAPGRWALPRVLWTLGREVSGMNRGGPFIDQGTGAMRRLPANCRTGWEIQ